MNASRQKMENHFRKEALKYIRDSLKEMVLTSSPDMEIIHSVSNPSLDEETTARMELIRRYSKSYDLISQILEKFIIGMKEVVDFHRDEGKLFFQLATGKSDWHLLGEKDRKSLVRDINLINAIDNGNEDVARLLAIDHLINYIRHGKITFHNSYYYQDLGYLILANVCKKDIPIDDVSLAVERSNYMKRKSRIMEGSNTRVERQRAGLLLVSAELILCCAGLYHLSKGWGSSKSPINLSDIRLFIPA
jgi:hypothetical protein